MEHGILRVSETAETEIEAKKAFVVINVTSEKLLFGNAAITASDDLKTVIDKTKAISETVEVETESVAIETNSNIFGKNSAATYTVKLIVNELDKLGSILGICSEGKRIKIRSVIWDYDDEEEKLSLIKEAVKKAKNKADQMMETIGYSVTGIRSCSDSYKMPNIGEVVLNELSAKAESRATLRAKNVGNPVVNIGTEFKSKKQIAATCTVEFLIQEKS